MIKIFSNPKFQNVNAYLIHNETKKAVLVDTAYGMFEEINKFIREREIILTDIFLTHTHFDHIVGLNEIYNANNEPTVRLSSGDLLGLFDPNKNFSTIYSINSKPFICKPMKKMKVVQDGEILEINGNTIRCILAAGHTQGMMMFDFQNLHALFNGDNIFLEGYSTIGKGLGVNIERLKNSFKWILNNFPNGYLLFPGHHNSGIPIRDILKYNTRLKKYLELNVDV